MTEWRLRPISDLCTYIVDCVNKTAPISDFATPFKMLRTTNVRDGWVDTSNTRRVDEEVYKRWTRRMRPERGDVILTREAPLGEVGMLRTDELVFLGQRLVMYRADPAECDPQFLMYSMLGPRVQAELRSLGSGATVEHLRVPDCEKLSIPCPELPIQQRIGAILGALDSLIENNRRRVGVLEEMARSIYREWFVHYRFPGHENVLLVDSPVGRVPENWIVSTCGDELNLIGGGTPSKSVRAFWDAGTVRWFTPSDLTKSRWRYTAEPELRITAVGVSSSSARLFPAGSVLMTSRATLGVLAIATAEATTNQGFIVLLPDERWSPGFIREWADAHAEKLAAIGTGATFKEITKGAFKRFPFVVPVAEVLNAHRSATDPLEKQIQNLEREIRVLSKLRDLLLPKLVTGQIDVSSLDLDALVEGSVA